ncbi:Scd6-like Sm domain containing protein, putative [Trypanosoma equiperdum]|uniref:Uncharacterized protein n=4 Tax=Trypanozoon TaxID=39700 RepID=Q387J6_TRYB2|nr:hypothetical protein, conserved [Trypanosoma brucei gambiense DAL972]XP_828147.1 hypothetical protein, conserved [Trypanosoma brucei brucei TREU927]RHW68481.1 Scd6-like Sm domain containing protein [Trypanosoma brucei equiperdum]SCU64883.1 Scd6-like Sm domain containing protein, putative [Trypanosoma equiperdum]EAN79035.1 hypothetical protein, conserved [Trypanosoma brucei brucei TREU927]CBH16937.1 hypothetical protein, conserved [Trypanosoma brucei gambiense DAL972]|eukprot:XP_011779201.1 hypothetical protein, conserved [Trypanosoma brucei gambiense DAL972]
MAATRAIGSTITLITNSQIRYEGTLGHIDASKNTVSLTNVRVFGTEGRAKEKGQVEVPAAEQLFDQIVFRGSDIEELTVFEESHNAMMDPAVVTALPARNNNNNNNTSSGNNNNNAHSNNNNNMRMPQSPQRHGGASMGPGHHQKQQHMYSGGYRRGGRGGYRSGRRVDSHTGRDFHPATGTAKEEFKDDFDFIKSREEFEKKKSEFEKAKEDAKNHSKAYDRSNFFDKISCDQQDRAPPLDREGMKRTDAETFGSEMVGNMRGPRRGRGGRGRYNGRYN